MSAIVTDQFRILNASNFIDSFSDPNNSYYIFVGLPNPTTVGFGRNANWNQVDIAPVDNVSNIYHASDTMMYGRRVTTSNVRRVIRRIDWASGTRYEMYRSDYSLTNPSPLTQSTRLYDANYYVMNRDYKVYICIDNGSSGINTIGNASQDEPLFTDLEPSRAGESGDGYLWKYLFTVAPGDIIKFDSTEYITVPNDWLASSDAQIQSVRENSDSDVNNNKIKKVYIDKQGSGYSASLNNREVSINGDGTGGKVVLTVTSGKITNAVVTSGGKGYTFGQVDLETSIVNSITESARLIPIIPPSKGHGFDIYQELGTDRVMLYARFDDSTKDFPIDTKFAQVGILKNPTSIGSTSTFTGNQFSSTYAIKFNSGSVSLQNPQVGEIISQQVTNGIAYGYVVSYDAETNVLKYIQDRSLYFNTGTYDETDSVGISTRSRVLSFESSANPIGGNISGFSGSVDTGFSGITTNPTGNKLINLGIIFNKGLASPEINKGSGQIIYLDNRPLITRNTRQKEDIKIILEF